MTAGAKGTLLPLLVIAAAWAAAVGAIYAAPPIDHPYIDAKDLKTETCLICHPTKDQGKFVHTALRKGCQACHLAVSSADNTTITLRAAGGALCARCHHRWVAPVLHGPYQAGQCLICHNPHAGAYRAHTRAAVDTLCLSCHMLNQPEARVNSHSGSVTLLDGRDYDLASWERAPKINSGHPLGPGPAGGNGSSNAQPPAKPEAWRNCLACHSPHASKLPHLLHQAAKAGGR